MKLQNRKERILFLFGFLIGVFLSGIFALISFSNSRVNQSNQIYQPESSHPFLVEINSVGCHASAIVPASEKININTSSFEEFDILPGIGEVKARSIVIFRQKYGNFKTINEIIYVSGISESIFQQICNSNFG